MRLVVRWGVAVAVSAAGFALAWWVCGKLIGLDEGVSLAIAGAVLAVLLAVAAWWAPQGADSGGSDGNGGSRLVQTAWAGQDIYIAGRDQAVVNDNRVVVLAVGSVPHPTAVHLAGPVTGLPRRPTHVFEGREEALAVLGQALDARGREW